MTDASTRQPLIEIVGVSKHYGEGETRVDALRDVDVPLERALLIGGAAQSPAVRAIAPEALGLPVEVPPPGEYVALGAARQAARIAELPA